MKKICIHSNHNYKEVIVTDSKTVRQILDEAAINYANGLPRVDGLTLLAEDLDRPISQFSTNDEVHIGISVKADNAAELVVAGNVGVLKSEVKLEDYVVVKKYEPDALVLVDDKGNEVFAVDVDDVPTGDANKYGVCFSSTPTRDGYAQVSFMIDCDAESLEDVLEDEYGAAIANLETIEANIADVLEDIHTTREMVRSKITIM